MGPLSTRKRPRANGGLGSLGVILAAAVIAVARPSVAAADPIPVSGGHCLTEAPGVCTDVYSFSVFGEATAIFGRNGAIADSRNTFGDTERVSRAWSEWADVFTLLGGSGPVTYNVLLEGEILSNRGPEGVFMGKPDVHFSAFGALGSFSTVCPLGCNEVVREHLSFTIDAVQNVPYAFGLSLEAFAGPYTASAFLTTALVTSIDIPGGTTLISQSGTVYGGDPESTVPEPSTLSALGLGLAAMAWRTRRRRGGDRATASVFS